MRGHAIPQKGMRGQQCADTERHAKPRGVVGSGGAGLGCQEDSLGCQEDGLGCQEDVLDARVTLEQQDGHPNLAGSGAPASSRGPALGCQGGSCGQVRGCGSVRPVRFGFPYN